MVFYTVIAFILSAGSVSAAQSPAQQSSEGGSIGSLLGICLVSMGCLVFILSVVKHLALTNKPKKTFSHPVLLDKLTDAGRVKLQKQITQAGHVTNPVATENEDRKFDHPTITQMEETEQVEELLHVMAGTEEDYSEESF